MKISHEDRHLQKSSIVTGDNKAEQNDRAKAQNAEMQKRTDEETVRENVGEFIQIVLYLTKYYND